MPWGLLVAVMCLWACLSVLLTLWMALLLVERSLKSITKMCVGVVRTLLGQPDPDSPEVRFEEEIGNSSPMFETLPEWQNWGAEVHDVPPHMPRLEGEAGLE